MRLASCILLALPLAMGSEPVRPPAVPYHVQLIWGTNREKPKEAEFRRVDGALEGELRHVFQWQHYWEVARRDVVVAGNKPATVQLSPECRVQIEFVSSIERELRIYGKGVLVTRSRRKISCRNTAIHGGTTEAGGSWFVVVRDNEPREGQKPESAAQHPSGHSR